MAMMESQRSARSCKPRPRTLFILLSAVGIATANAEANWPHWRGPQDNGSTPGGTYPVRWDAEKVLWKAPLPGKGCSTPIVWNGHVFITQAIEKENRRTLMCFDQKSGKPLWQSGVTYTEKEPTHETNPYCSA